MDVSFCFVFTSCLAEVELFFEEKESIRVGLVGAGFLRELVGGENPNCEQQLTELALSPKSVHRHPASSTSLGNFIRVRKNFL